jgi:hypothetical protein
MLSDMRSELEVAAQLVCTHSTQQALAHGDAELLCLDISTEVCHHRSADVKNGLSSWRVLHMQYSMLGMGCICTRGNRISVAYKGCKWSETQCGQECCLSPVYAPAPLKLCTHEARAAGAAGWAPGKESSGKQQQQRMCRHDVAATPPRRNDAEEIKAKSCC